MISLWWLRSSTGNAGPGGVRPPVGGRLWRSRLPRHRRDVHSISLVSPRLTRLPSPIWNFCWTWHRLIRQSAYCGKISWNRINVMNANQSSLYGTPVDTSSLFRLIRDIELTSCHIGPSYVVKWNFHLVRSCGMSFGEKGDRFSPFLFV